MANRGKSRLTPGIVIVVGLLLCVSSINSLQSTDPAGGIEATTVTPAAAVSSSTASSSASATIATTTTATIITITEGSGNGGDNNATSFQAVVTGMTTAAALCPVVTSASPVKGPVAGGTAVVIHGSGLNRVTSWVTCLGASNSCSLPNSISNSNDAMLTLKTSQYSTTDTVRLVLIAINCQTVEAVNFTFTNNPAITSFTTPFQTILEGGIAQTIFGSSLDAAEEPKFSVTVQYKSSTQMSAASSACTVVNSTQLVCWTPSLKDKVIEALGTGVNTTIPAGQNITSSGFTFNVSIIFDGWTVGIIAPLLVYQHPQLVPLTPLQTFIANENRAITIQGQALSNHGFTVADITVRVGTPGQVKGTECTDVTLDDTSLTCRPPPMNYEHIRYPTTSVAGINPAQPNVTVLIGQYSFSANQLQYTLDESFNVIMSVMIAIIAFIIVVSFVFGILTLCQCGQPGNSLHSLDSVPYEQMQDSMEETRGDSANINDKHTPKHSNNDTAIECKAMRYKPQDGVNNEGLTTDEYQTMTL